MTRKGIDMSADVIDYQTYKMWLYARLNAKETQYTVDSTQTYVYNTDYIGTLTINLDLEGK